MTPEPADAPPLLLTVDEAAARLRVHPSTLRKLIYDGRLACVRIGRKVMVTPDQITEFIDDNRRKAPLPARDQAILDEVELNKIRADAVLALQNEAARRAENPWGRTQRSRRRRTP